MRPIDPELFEALAEQPVGFGGPVWSGPAANLAAFAERLGDPEGRLQSFREGLEHGYFTQFTAYSDPAFAARVVDWQLGELAAAGLTLADLPNGFAESPLVRPETCVQRGGRLLSPDFVRYLFYLRLFQQHGVLSGPRPRVVEIGSGYGGLARVLKQHTPGATIFQVDLPASLVSAYLFLRSEFPEARLVVARAGDTPAAFDGADFVFVPVHRVACLRGAAVDLAMNVWSFGEIPNELNRDWFELLQSGMTVDWVFLLNSFLKRIGPTSPNELCFGKWLTWLDERWRVADFEIDPRVHRCPYVTNFPNGAAVLAQRIHTAGELEQERRKARAGFESLLEADWITAVGQDGEGDPGPFLGTGHHIGRWHTEPGMTGPVFRLWQQVRLNGDPRALRLLLTHLRILRGHGSDNFRFKDEFYFRELISSEEVARERAVYFLPPPSPPPPPPPPSVQLSIQDACDLATAARNNGALELAGALYHQILEAIPGHAECIFQLAATAELQGDMAGASDWYCRALTLAPENPNYRQRAVSACAARGWALAYADSLAAAGRPVPPVREQCLRFVREAFARRGLEFEGDASALPDPPADLVRRGMARVRELFANGATRGEAVRLRAVLGRAA